MITQHLNMMAMGKQARRHQAGYATLGIAAVLVFILSLMTIYLTRSGIIDIRTSANKTRYAQALADAERKLEAGLGWMTKTDRSTWTPNTWVLCNTLTTKAQALGATWRCLPQSITYTGGAASFVLATPAALGAIGRTYFIVAEGASNDGSGSAVVKQGVYFYSSNGGASHAPPMMGSGNVPLSGNFTVVPNPNSGGTGVPVSIWSKVLIDVPSGSAATCQLGEYLQAGNNCTGTSVITSSAGKGADIVDNDANFPSDVFQYVFGVPTDNYGTVKAQANTTVTNCANLTGLTGIVWVTGDCTIPSGTTVGSLTAPLMLVVETGDFTMNADSTFYGMLVAFGPPPSPYNAGAIKANGGAKFYGSIVSNDTTSMGLQINGTFDMIYLKEIMDALSSDTSTQFKLMARMPGSWTDFL